MAAADWEVSAAPRVKAGTAQTLPFRIHEGMSAEEVQRTPLKRVQPNAEVNERATATAQELQRQLVATAYHPATESVQKGGADAPSLEVGLEEVKKNPLARKKWGVEARA